MSPLRLLAAAAAVIVLGVAILLISWQRSSDGVLAGVHLGDENLSGLSRQELAPAVDEAIRESLDQPVVVRGDRSTNITVRSVVGARTDTDAMVDAVWRRGRQGNPLTAFVDHAAARMGRIITVEPAETIDEEITREWAEAVAATMSRQSREASIRFARGPRAPDPDDETSRVLPIEPAPGEVVDGGDLAQRAIEALEAGGPVTLDAPADIEEPAIGQEDLEAALPQARRSVSTPMTLRNPSDAASLDLVPADLAAVLVARGDPDAPEGERLTVGVNPRRLRRRLGGDRVAAIEGDPSDARFVVDGDRVRIRGGRSGYRFNAEAVATRMEQLIADGDAEGTLPGDPVEPDFTRAEARDLGIERKVSEFTTEHACCQSRVTNIQRMADIVDGAIIRPDEHFSLNDHVGRRTRDNGFVGGGVIVEGEFEEEVGGGVSQFATTFFNAALFSGIDIHEFQPHSYYIDRYPMGHESTLYYGAIDVVVQNDSPYGILVKTSHTDTSITVMFYSSSWAEVDVDVEPRRNVVEGDIRDGFDVSWTRTITYPDGDQETEEYFHRYEPENEPDNDE